MKNLRLILSILLLSALSLSPAHASKIQKAGIVSASDCATRGVSNANCLPNAAQVYDSVNAQQLSLTLTNIMGPAQTISGSVINWASSSLFVKALTANITFTFSNLRSGQTIIVRLTNTASNWLVTWPAVKWPAGTAPTMSPGVTSDVYTFFYDGSNVYGTVIPDMR